MQLAVRLEQGKKGALAYIPVDILGKFPDYIIVNE